MPNTTTNFRKYFNLSWQYAILIIFVLIIFVPILIMIWGGMKTRGEFATYPYQPPNPIRWENYIGILSTDTFWIMLRNSLIVTVGTVVGVVFFASLAAFIFARTNSGEKKFCLTTLLSVCSFPSALPSCLSTSCFAR